MMHTRGWVVTEWKSCSSFCVRETTKALFGMRDHKTPLKAEEYHNSQIFSLLLINHNRSLNRY
jgi:hypothetical protein